MHDLSQLSFHSVVFYHAFSIDIMQLLGEGKSICIYTKVSLAEVTLDLLSTKISGIGIRIPG